MNRSQATWHLNVESLRRAVPVREDSEFLIGSSSICDLVLPSAFPEFIAMVTEVDDELFLAATSDRVGILVNGCLMGQRCMLKDTDLVEIGPAKFSVERRATQRISGTDPAHLLALELVNLIDCELAIIDDLESEEAADRFARMMDSLDPQQMGDGRGRSAA